MPWIPPLLLTLSVAAVQVCIPLLPAPNPKNTPWPGLQILGQPVAALQAVVDYVQRQGVTGKSCRAEGRGLALTPVHEGDKRAEVECGQARLGSIEWFQILRGLESRRGLDVDCLHPCLVLQATLCMNNWKVQHSWPAAHSTAEVTD